MLNYKITELAEEAGVSDASVVRFCKSVGYKGYQDFKVNAARDVLPRDKHFNPSLEQGDEDVYKRQPSHAPGTASAL